MAWKRNPKQEKLQDARRRAFRGDVATILAQHNWTAILSNEEIAEKTATSVRTAKRYMKYWVDMGTFAIKTQRHKLAHGWSVQRHVSIPDEDQRKVFAFEMERYGRVN